MKRLLITLMASLALLFGGGVAMAAPRNTAVSNPDYTTVNGVFTDPSCPGTYTKQITTNKSGVSVKLSTDTTNDLVYVNFGGTSVQTGSGDDCVVVVAGSDGNSLKVNDGNDTVNNNGSLSGLYGGNGDDLLNSNGTRDSLKGEAGVDTCNYDAFTSSAKTCEL